MKYLNEYGTARFMALVKGTAIEAKNSADAAAESLADAAEDMEFIKKYGVPATDIRGAVSEYMTTYITPRIETIEGQITALQTSIDSLDARVRDLEGATLFADTPKGKTLTYSGSAQTLVDAGTGFTILDPSSDTGTNCGNYNVVCRLQTGYKWSDNTTEDKVVTTVINPMPITIPAACGQVNKKEWTGSEITFDQSTDYYTVSGETKGTEAKAYTVTYTLNNKNYAWSDGTTGTKNATFEIVAVYYVYYGASAAVPTMIDETYKKSLPLSGTLDITTTKADKCSCHWVAMVTASGYSVKSATDILGTNIISQIKSSVIGNYTMYYLSADGYYSNTTKFTISK